MQQPTPHTEKIQILGTNIDRLTLKQALQKSEDFIRQGAPHRIVTLNAEMAYLAYTDQAFQNIVNTADMVTPDGSGIIWAAHKYGAPLLERVTGIDLMLALTAEAAAKGHTLFFYGAAPGVAQEAAERLKLQYPGLQIKGVAHGYLAPEQQQELIGQINSLKPDILFAALGAPRQEFWLAEHLEQLQVPVCMGVGGSFDVIAGRVKRAPKIWQKLKLEWLYRLLQEPKRLKRALALPKFTWTVLTTARKNS